MRFMANGKHRSWFIVSAVSVSSLALLLTAVGIAAAAPKPKPDKTVQFESATYEVTEGEGSALVTVDRSVTKGKAPVVTVTTTGGTATAGVDYTTVDTTVSFSRGGQGYVTVPILVDGVPGEPDETVTLTLTVDPSSRGWSAGTPDSATLTIHEMAAPMDAPTHLDAKLVSATTDNPYVHLTWAAPSQYYGSYWIGSSTTEGGPYTEVDTATGSSYDVTPAPSDGTYYVVAAMNADMARSSYTNEVFVGGLVPGSGLYWVNGLDVGRIMTANPDGSGVHTLITGQTESFGIAVDGKHIYWSNVGADTIMRSDLDGKNATAIVKDQSHPYGVAVDSNYVYWTNFEGQTIMRSDLDGNNVTKLVDLTGTGRPAGLAVDADYLYIADTAGNGSIMRAPLSGGDASTIIETQPYPFGIAVYGSHIYWTECGDNSEPTGKVMAANLDGGAVTTLASNQAHPVGIAVNSSHIYWANANTGEIVSSDLNGGPVTTLVSGQNSLSGVAVAS